MGEFSEEQLDTLLKEVGIFSTNTKETEIQEESLEKMLDEIMRAPQPAPSSAPPPPPFPFEEKKLKKTKMPLLLSLALLGGFFFGTLFGYYWGKTQKVEFQEKPYEEIQGQLSTLMSDVKEILEKIHTPLSAEIIEPLLEPPSETEKLAPEVVS